jgi:hypothetical protein
MTRRQTPELEGRIDMVTTPENVISADVGA